MDKIEKDLSKLRKMMSMVFALLGGFILVTLIVAFLFLRKIQIEDYCQKKAQNIVGDKWNMLLESTEEERRKFPGIDQISWGFREQLNCENEQKIFYLF